MAARSQKVEKSMSTRLAPFIDTGKRGEAKNGTDSQA
jgi:hypothetical protein